MKKMIKFFKENIIMEHQSAWRFVKISLAPKERTCKEWWSASQEKEIHKYNCRSARPT